MSPARRKGCTEANLGPTHAHNLCSTSKHYCASKNPHGELKEEI